MGSPISPIFSDLVMTDLETECLSKLDFKPLFYFRYVDDILTCIPKDKIQQMLFIFNNYNDRLQFTYELESNNCLSFLDVLIIKKKNKFQIPLNS